MLHINVFAPSLLILIRYEEIELELVIRGFGSKGQKAKW